MSPTRIALTVIVYLLTGTTAAATTYAVFMTENLDGVSSPRRLRQQAGRLDEPEGWVIALAGLFWPLSIVVLLGIGIWLGPMQWIAWALLRRRAIIENGIRKLNGGNLP